MVTGTTARQYQTQQTHYIAVDVAGSDGAQTVDIGIIPAGSFITHAGFVVRTAFNGTGTVSMGPSTDTDGLMSAVVITATGAKDADDIGTSDDVYVSSATTFQAVVGGTPTAGAGLAYVYYIPDNRN
ncbi:MAG: hypothetical protein AAGA08_16900 [Pseudomonadota bacterium]